MHHHGLEQVVPLVGVSLQYDPRGLKAGSPARHYPGPEAQTGDLWPCPRRQQSSHGWRRHPDPPAKVLEALGMMIEKGYQSSHW